MSGLLISRSFIYNTYTQCISKLGPWPYIFPTKGRGYQNIFCTNNTPAISSGKVDDTEGRHESKLECVRIASCDDYPHVGVCGVFSLCRLRQNELCFCYSLLWDLTHQLSGYACSHASQFRFCIKLSDREISSQIVPVSEDPRQLIRQCH